MSDEDAQRLRYLGSLGIVPGAIVEVVQRAPYGGPIAVLIEGAQRQIGPELAAQVIVGPA